MPKHAVLVSALALSAGLVATVVPALAADRSVSATPDDSFSPAAVTITQGEKVTWSNAGGRHNVRFDGESVGQPTSPATNAWSVSRTFGTPGTYTYYCERHRDVGMTGTVVVEAAPGTGTGPVPPGGGGGPGPEPPAGGAPAPVVTHFTMTRTRFRVGPGPTARIAARAKRGSAFDFQLSRDASVRIAVSRVLTGRGGKRRYAGRGALVRRHRRAGANAVPFSGRLGKSALATGLYRATITATAANGGRSQARRTSFRIVAR